MKFFTSIFLPCALILALGFFPTTSALACSGKTASCKKEVKEMAKKQHAKCQKDCCKKPCSDSKNKKKGCCGDDCQCATPILILADLPKTFSIILSMQSVFIIENAFYYKKSFPNSSVQDIWQPPISVLS